MKPDIGFIYKLIDPITNDVRYIGQTVLKLKIRLNKHICDSNRLNTHVNCWIKGLIKKGQKPLIETVEICSFNILDDREIFYISEYKKKYNLTNISEGGAVRRIHSEDMKKRISNSLKGKRQSKETRLKRKISAKLAWQDEDLRERQRLNSIKNRNKISRAGIPSPKKGKPFAGDRNKVSESLKKYYSANIIYNKKKIYGQLIKDYNDKSILLCNVAKIHNISRNTITAIMKRNNIPLRRII